MSAVVESERTEPASATIESPKHRVLELLERYGLLVLFAAVLLTFSVWPRTGTQFLSHSNLLQIVGNQMIITVVAMAAMLPLSCGYFDLSPGAATGTASIACAALMVKYHAPIPLAISGAILIGALIGLINGLLVARFRLSAIITTLAMLTALSGIDNWYTGGATITNVPIGFQNFGSLNWLGVPRLLYVVFPLVLLMWYMENWTPFGRYQRAIQSSPRSAKLVGVGVERVVLASFVGGGVLAGVAGVLLVARSGGADSTTGPSVLFPALAAVFLGATAFKPGRPNTLGTVVGVFFVAFSVSGLTLAGASSWVNDLFNGLALFVAGGLSTFFARQRGAGHLL